MILIIDCGSTKTKYIEQVTYEFIDTKMVSFFEFELSMLNEVKGVIISGAPILITEVGPDPYLDKMSWITSTTLPVFGICFGHQIIGLLHGALANRMKEDRSWQIVEVYENCPLFLRLPQELKMMEDHCEGISIPQGFQLVASSDACVNEAMEHTEKPIYGVQFHPEVSGNHGAIILENFAKICSGEFKIGEID
ncbi:MAG: gamma-glutamyl-gamma-aminobutyrate hydrolase family protein [Crocinitomicaceae bacterium]|nr:gamma-glutamyl-gamma-aminobutyrate hydrolase family protein [Crocinitomicaceae bacterium]MDG1657515.1 gamma-glutamyl-gamma-aminobutyrate hydrolase family protein [Crocinitomicaceae bacterium]